MTPAFSPPLISYYRRIYTVLSAYLHNVERCRRSRHYLFHIHSNDIHVMAVARTGNAMFLLSLA